MDNQNAHAFSYAFHTKTCTLIEEPLFTVDNVETMKLIMGGENILLNPKNMSPFVGKSKAVTIMTANDIPWRNYPPLPFENRCYIYEFKNECQLSFRMTPVIFWDLIKLLFGL